MNGSIVRNLALAANVKIELVAELLRKGGHAVDILSQGAIVDPTGTFYPGFQEAKLFDATIPITYAPALPIRPGSPRSR